MKTKRISTNLGTTPPCGRWAGCRVLGNSFPWAGQAALLRPFVCAYGLSAHNGATVCASDLGGVHLLHLLHLQDLRHLRNIGPP